MSLQQPICVRIGIPAGPQIRHTMSLRKCLLHSSVLEFLLQLCVRSLENLLMRFEEPSSMVRWDTPLFTILWTDEMIPGEQIWDSITKGNLKPPNSGTLSVGYFSPNNL